MKHFNFERRNVLYVLLAVLVLLYGVNMFTVQEASKVLIGTPTKLTFLIIEPPKTSCSDCFDGNKIAQMVDKAHKISYNVKTISYGSAVTKKNIEMYNLKNLPAVIVSGDITDKGVTNAWKALAGETKKGSIVIENLLPYYDLQTNTVRGVVNAILLKDKTCTSCFDEQQYIKTLKRFGINMSNVKTYDIASKQGRELVNKYAITKVPMVILSSGVGAYPSFSTSWKTVGTIEKDGSYVFRNVQKISQSYKKI